MKICWIFVYLITVTAVFAQVDPPPRALPDARIVRLTLDTRNRDCPALRPGYVDARCEYRRM